MKIPVKYSVLIIVFVLIAALCAGCTQQAQTQGQPKEVKVGVIASLTGPASNVGKNMWQSAQLAADEINAKGGVSLKDGSKVPLKVIVGDDESTQQGGQKAATQLITGDKVDILVGGQSSPVTMAYQ
jgi:branched-chain amino acid transport system substrate-binding protein